VAVHLVIIVAIGARVLMKRRPPGSSAAWLLSVVLLPYAGAVLYLFIGERPLGKRRARKALEMRGQVERWVATLAERSRDAPTPMSARWSSIRRLADGAVGLPVLGGNRFQLLDGAELILRSLIDDVDAARHFCLLEFYIWNPGGTADEVGEALIRAVARGVKCRVLLDAVGSKDFLRSRWPERFRDAGVELHSALPASALRAAFRRVDLRLHRKIAVIDGHVAYTGSLNLVDPRCFKQGAGVGEWVDAMARIKGPAVEALAGLFAWDWAMESGAPLAELIEQIDVPMQITEGAAEVQMVPSGPGYEGNGIMQVLLSAVYAAREELILTTPYFVPDESLVAALQAAAQRGVKVRLIVPARVDSFLVRHASRAYFSDLLRAGVEILQFDAGLLHTKSVVVDRELALFGTLNLDLRSFLLNFEVTLIVYDATFAETVAALAAGYAERAKPLNLQAWDRRPISQRLTDNLVQIMSPLL